MTFDADRPARGPRPIVPPRRRSPLRLAIAAVVVVVIGAIVAANIFTEVAWFNQLGYGEVWRVEWATRAALFASFAILAAAAVWLTLRWAKAVRPAVSASRSTPLDQYREQIQPIERVVTWVLPAVVAFIAGVTMSGKWAEVQAFLHRSSFGFKDPQFNLDASFYVFTLPVLKSAVAFCLSVAILCGVLAAFIHLLYGGISGSGRVFVASKGARTQLGVLGFVIMLAIAASYVLGRFSLVLNDGKTYSGATYTDVNALVPGRGILAGIAVIVGLMFLLIIWRGDWRIPATGVALMVISAIAVGGIYPAVVQNFQVGPNEQELEAPYIQRDIDATRYAYGIADTTVVPYEAKTEADADALRADAETTAQIRLLDPNVVAPTFQQLQQNKQYYSFPRSTLTVDRYRIDGKLRDTVIAVRELNLEGLSAENRSWVNDHTVYTHGYGVVAAYGAKVASDGKPDFFQSGIPSTGELGDFEPRIYFAPSMPAYSIVGAPEGSKPWELDYPDDAAGGQVNTTYTGDGGPSIGSEFAKLMYAIKLGEQQILFSSRVTSDSQILYYRDPIERVQKVAPYLTLDGTTYPAVVDGKVVWIVDGYTTTNSFPYSASISTPTLFANPDQANPTVLNYIRNSVKATVDAYDGSVTLYAWDADDPILKTWSKVYPGTIKPYSEMSGDLMSHIRYPEDLFEVQRFQLTRYHVTDAAQFYSGQDFWANPADPANPEQLQPPYYLTMQMPGQDEPSFSLSSSFVPIGTNSRQVLTGFLAVNSETGNTPGVKDPDYGTLRLLELPSDATIPGPGQVQTQFRADTEATKLLNILRQGDTDVIYGNLLTLPVGGGLLYVQPVYVKASKGTQFPLLRKVFVAFGENVGFADTVGQALDQIFGDGSSVIPDDGTDTPDTGDGGDVVTDPTTAQAQAQLTKALADAQQALADGQEALAEGDFAAYGAAQSRLQAALERALAADAVVNGTDGQGDADAAGATPSPTPSATNN